MSTKLTPEDVRILREIRLWQKRFTVRGAATFANTPKGATLYIPPAPPSRAGGEHPFVWIRPTSNHACFGTYNADIVKPPAAEGDLPSGAVLLTTDLYDATDAVQCVAMNVRELGASTHDVEFAGFLPTVFLAEIVHVNADGTPVCRFDGAQHEDCS